MTYSRLFLVVVMLVGSRVMWAQDNRPIDRQAVVTRHNVNITELDPLSPLSVGNGDFAFTVDVTGLQTFSDAYEKGTPLTTMSQWGWHSNPMSDAAKAQQIHYTDFDTYGRKVGYLTGSTGWAALYAYLRENPHRYHLGRVGLRLQKADGSAATPADLKNIHQTLDLWTGILTSEFEFEGKPVKVQTACGGTTDAIAVRVESALKPGVVIAFPYASPGNKGYDWTKAAAHQTKIDRQDAHSATLARQLDDAHYTTALAWTGDAQFKQDGPHEFQLQSSNDKLEFVCSFSPNPIASVASASEMFDASRKFWSDYWNSGGAIDLAGSTDPRANELERRIILSEYVTAVNNSGNLPPAETGLVANATWYGKFHLEMHWWHDVHFSLWGRQNVFERSMSFYKGNLAFAQGNAKRQGYAGARWPKMVGPDGVDSPSGIAPLLIWEQPHPIYYAELCYRANPTKETLDQWKEIVDQTAEFMASFAVRDPKTGKFNLGPPLKTVPEHTDAKTAINPTFELSYWRFGLNKAQEWRQRLGQQRNPVWDDVLKDLAPLPQKDGLYLSEGNQEDTWTNWNWEHPSLIGAMGVLPGDGVDPVVMKSTLEKVMQVWQWDRCWGWDFPMAAMSAARVGRPDLAIDALLINSPKNRYLANGHVYQRDNLTLYLPANGGLLTAVSMMAAGWDGGPETRSPGFPREGWNVRWEGLKKMP